MNANLLEQLLYQEESDSLDFKRDQYKFIKANDNDKAELLKDILAFANSWCSEDAHILIGVNEVKGGRSILFGITDQLDDAAIQQFVNKKTNRPINFSYKAQKTSEGEIAAITIPRQQRPFYLTKDFGTLKKHTVYVRRGSSTDIASLDEIAQMGQSTVRPVVPSLDLNFADFRTGKILGKFITVRSRVLDYDQADLPDYGSSGYLDITRAIWDNKNYYRQYAVYEKAAFKLSKFRFAVSNKSGVLLSNVRIKLVSELSPHFEIKDSFQIPSVPSKQSNSINDLKFRSPLIKVRSIKVVEKHDSVTSLVEMLDIQPQAEEISDENILFGGDKNGLVILSATVFADNLAEPAKFELKVNLEVETIQLDLERFFERVHRFG